MTLPTRRWLACMCVLLFPLLASSAIASAQTYTFGQGLIPAGKLPFSVATADLNGDGKLDLVVANLEDSTISVFLGKPDGTFAAPATYSTGPHPSSVVLGDFDGDGDLDVVVTNENCVDTPHISTFECGSGSISILLGNGDGTFQSHKDFPSAQTPVSVLAADMNGDGKLDLIVANNLTTNTLGESNNSVSIFLGNGDGTFQDHVDYANPSGQVGGGINAWVAVADFNGDGNLDVASNYSLPQLNNGTFPAEVAVYLGNGDGTLRVPSNFPLQAEDQWTTTSSAVAADFNRDGKQDLAITTNAGVEIFLGNGDGTFSFKGSGGGGAGQIVAVDLNQDGKLDLVTITAAASAGAITAILGNGDGTFQSDTEFNMLTGISPTALAIGDFNGDGRLDVLATVANDATLLAGTSPPDGSIAIFLGEGGNVFGATVLSTASGAPKSVPAALTAADLNGDGNLDLAFVNTGQTGSSVDNTVSILIGKGDGTFQAQQTFGTGTFPVDVQIADFNGDGKPDLAVANQNCALTATGCSAGSVSVLLGNGDGTFQPHRDFGVGVTPVGLTVADFTGNGKPGVAVVNNALGQGTTMSVLTGNGDGTLNGHTDYTVPGPPTAIASGDFNNDGKSDVVVSSLRNSSPQAPVSSTPNVSTFLGKGDGTFQQPVNSPLTTASFIGPGYLLAPTDLDGDGKLDLVGGHIDDPAFGLIYGRGDGTFNNGGNTGGAFGSVVVAPVTGLFALGDFNSDGHVDIALVDTGDSLVILQGDGQGGFQQTQRLLAPTGFDLSNRIVAAGDFNRDGGLDLAVVQPSAPTAAGIVSVYLNEAFKAVYPTSLAFGSQGLTTESATQTVTISNPSVTAFRITSIAASGPFNETNNCGASLAPKATCAVSVQFAPVAEGTASGALTLKDSTHSSPQMIPLMGSGVTGPFLQAAPARVFLGSANSGTPGAPQTVTLGNTGNVALTINGIGITGGNSGDFSQTNTCGSSLAIGATCSVTVTFTPTGAGSRASALAITDNAPGSPQAVKLTGTGLGSQIGLTPASLTFAAQSVGTASAAQTVTLTNSGTAPASISQISATGDFKETNTCGATLGPSASCQISVTFAPTAGGSRSGSLTVVSPTSPTVALSGIGINFSVAAGSGGSGTSATVAAGATATYQLSLAGGVGFSGTVALTCSGAPPDATCSISPSSVPLAGTTVATATVTVTTTARSLVGPFSRYRGLFIFPAQLLVATLAAILALLLFNLSSMHRRQFVWRPLAAFSLLIGLATVVMSGCGGGSSGGTPSNPTGGTAAGNYTIAVSATAGSGANAVSHTTKLTLIVQ